MSNIAIGDADGLISLALSQEPNHDLAVAGTLAFAKKELKLYSLSEFFQKQLPV